MEGMGMKGKGMDKGGMKSMARKPMAVESKESAPNYPSITLEEHMMPEMKGMKIGDTCHLKMEGKITGVNKYGNGEVEYRIDLEKGMMDMGKEEKSKK